MKQDLDKLVRDRLDSSLAPGVSSICMDAIELSVVKSRLRQRPSAETKGTTAGNISMQNSTPIGRHSIAPQIGLQSQSLDITCLPA
jgi:hypothetical protein